MTAPQVLIADGDPTFRGAVGRQLERHGYVAVGVASASDASAHLADVDVALVNIELPDADGLDLCRQLRERRGVIIIVITRSMVELEHVLAFQAGADHCVPPQTGIREIVARIGAVRRRDEEQEIDRPVEGVGEVELRTTVDDVELVVDRGTYTVTRAGEVVPMTRKEFDLLSVLVDNAGRNVPRDTLMGQVWSDDSGVRTRTLDTHVNSLRRKMGSRTAVQCVRGIGYRFDPS